MTKFYLPSSLTNFINDFVQPNSTICTDGWSGYNDLKSLEYNHEITVMSHSADQAHVSMPGVHRIAALLKRWILWYTSRFIFTRTFQVIFGRIYFSL